MNDDTQSDPFTYEVTTAQPRVAPCDKCALKASLPVGSYGVHLCHVCAITTLAYMCAREEEAGRFDPSVLSDVVAIGFLF